MSLSWGIGLRAVPRLVGPRRRPRRRTSGVRLRQAVFYWLFGADRYLRKLPPGLRVLDVGCSDGKGSAVLNGVSGVDIYRTALVAATGRRQQLVQADVRELPYRDGSFDVVVALDVIEHFDKPEALELLEELERLGRAEVVVFTPCGFLPQAGTAEEPWQRHRCGFEVEELEHLGYRVRGLGGPKWLRGEHGRFKGRRLGLLAVLLLSPLTPKRRSFALLGVKPLGGQGTANTEPAHDLELSRL